MSFCYSQVATGSDVTSSQPEWQATECPVRDNAPAGDQGDQAGNALIPASVSSGQQQGGSPEDPKLDLFFFWPFLSPSFWN